MGIGWIVWLGRGSKKGKKKPRRGRGWNFIDDVVTHRLCCCGTITASGGDVKESALEAIFF